MTTIRRAARPADQFTMISNSFHRDAQLSLAARGLGGYLLSHVDGWEITVQRLAKGQGIGREQMRRLLRELEDAGYLRRTQARDEHGLMGAMVYQISCTPIEDETPGGDRCPETRTPVNRGPVSGHHKKTTSEKTTSPEDQPSGGSPAGEHRPDGKEDEPMPPTPQSDALPLDFGETLTTRPRQNGKMHATNTAQAVVAAFVDSYRAHHSGGDPVKSNVGRVARDAARMLKTGQAGVPELMKAATAMGQGPWANLATQLSIVRERGTGPARIAPAAPRGSFAAAHAVSQAEFIQEIRTDPEVAAWVAEDPAAVAKLISEYPDLEAVFAKVTAA